jgi:hypothetical protein
MRKTRLFLFKISSIGICTGFCDISDKSPKFPLLGIYLIHQFICSQQYPQSGVFLTSFSTWGTENSLAEINLESTGRGCDKGL